jgi:putative SOS response-associated peptidase YedK
MEANRKIQTALRDCPAEPFAFAGLWENWKDPKTHEWLRTFTILTTQPNELVAPLHDRMPVILGRESYERWLGSEADPANLIPPYPAEEMITWPVSTGSTRQKTTTLRSSIGSSRRRRDASER